MTPTDRAPSPTADRGFTLIEVMIALVVLAIGIIAVSQLFPSGSRAQVQDHLLTGASDYAREKIEDLSTHAWNDSVLTTGRHPAAGAESLGTGNQWQRFYNVAVLAAPLNNLKKVDVTVTYQGAGLSAQRSVVATTYLRQ